MRIPFSVALCAVAVLCFLCPSPAFSQASARTLSRSLDQLVEEAHCIVDGVVLSSTIEPHPQLRNLMTQVVTLKVANTYKGRPQKTLVFRQYVGNVESGNTGSDYHKGQEMILLLGPVSEYGLTSPAGLEQGRFRIILDRTHRPIAINGRGNVGLFDRVEQAARARNAPLSAHLITVLRQSAAPLLVTDLEQIIRAFARSR